MDDGPLAAEPVHPTVGMVNIRSQVDNTPDASRAWEECANQVWAREEMLVKKWKDEISNLLTFAGLFSAVLTAFNVQYYVALQPQTQDPSVQAMLIALNMLAVRRGETDVGLLTLAAMDNSSSVTSTPFHVVSINTLWFSALLFSLSAASLAISVNQWLHHYVDHTTSRPHQSVQLWYFRHSMFDEWSVPLIISLLPVLLQTSLALFIAGLVQLLWTLNTIVATIVTALAALLLILSASTALIPAFAPSCPYKSQPALWCFRATSRMRRLLLIIVTRLVHDGHHARSSVSVVARQYLTKQCRERIDNWLKAQRCWLRASTWRDIDNMSMRLRRDGPDYALQVIECADSTLMDDAFLESVRHPQISQLTKHLSSLIHATPASTPNTLEFRRHALEIFHQFGLHSPATLENRCEMCSCISNSFLIQIAHPCLRQPDISIDAALALYYCICKHHIQRIYLTDLPDANSFVAVQYSQTVADMGCLSADIFSRLITETMLNDDDREKHQRRILGHIESLLNATMFPDPAVYGRLIDLLPAAGVSHVVRDHIAELISQYDGDILSGHARSSLTQKAFLQITSVALRQSVRLAIGGVSLNQIADELRGGLDIAAVSFASPETRTLVQNIKWSSNRQDHQAIIAMAQTFLDILHKITPAIFDDEHDRIAHQMRILALLQNLLDLHFGSCIGPANAVYAKLVRLLHTSRHPPEVQNQIVRIIWQFGFKYYIGTDDIRAIFALLPPPGGKGSVAQLIRLSFSALQHSAKVPLVQFPRVREDIRRGLALLAEHLTSPEIGQEIAEASMWYEMHMLFKICVDIAYIPSARGLFTLEVVKPLEFCATRCCRLEPPTWFRDGISDCMKSICSISGYQMSLEMHAISITKHTAALPPVPPFDPLRITVTQETETFNS
ncbi:hypothetical protein IEO21_07808 [Rhodonia placenta]|uniref:DUF6535 domain-containing protein n=1 Tax=Rhodonia placenta TaxID=104341 RepID=A0A8H7TZE4_9APHY|nr:hypothetical protein IEO21_07808 [Postia placenta]